MADTGNNLPEMPEKWDQYSRMLGDLPMRPLPPGADARLQARLASAASSPRPHRRWVVGGLSLLAGSVAVVVGMSIFGDQGEPAPKVSTKPTVVSEPPAKKRIHRRQPARRPTAPQVSDHPITIDSNPPREVPIPPTRQPDVTTGGERAVPGVPPRPRDNRTAP
jgi:hypothetical protein